MSARERIINRQKEIMDPEIVREVILEDQEEGNGSEDRSKNRAAAQIPPKRKSRRKKKKFSSISRFYPLFLFLFTWALHGAVAFQMTVPIIVPDELSTLGISAFLTGDDWSSLMSAYANYYGYGQALLAMPLFFFIRDNILLYKAVLLLYGMLMALIPVIAWHLITSVFRRPRNLESFLWALAMGLFPCYTIYSKFAWNETLIMLLPWVSVAWILYCIGEGRRIKEWMLALLLVAGYATHGRYLGVVIALLMMIWICQKFCRVGLLAWKKLLLWLGIFLGTDALIKWALVKRLWRLTAPGAARNTLSETLARNALLLLAPEGWQNLFRGLNGFTFDVAVVSFGLLFVSVSLFAYKGRMYALGLFHSVIRKYHKYGVELSFDENWKKSEEEVIYAVPCQETEEESCLKGEKEKNQEISGTKDGDLDFSHEFLEQRGLQNDPVALENLQGTSFKKKFHYKKNASSEAVILETLDVDAVYGPEEDSETDSERRRRYKDQRRQALLESTWLPVDKVHLILPEDFMKEESSVSLQEEEDNSQVSISGEQTGLGENQSSLAAGRSEEVVSLEECSDAKKEVLSPEDPSEGMVVVDLGGETKAKKNSGDQDAYQGEDSSDHEMWRRRRLLAAEFFLGGFSLLSMIFAIGIGSIFFLNDFGKADSEYYIIFGRYTEYLLAFHLLYLVAALGKKALPSKVMLSGFLLTALNFSLTYFWEFQNIGLKTLAGINVYVLLSYTPKFQLKTGQDLLTLIALVSGAAVLLLVLLRLNFKKTVGLLLLAAFLFSYGHTSYKEFLAMAKTQYGYVDATYELLYSLDEIYKDYPDIYLYDIKSPQIYQLPLRDFHLHKLNKEESKTEYHLNEGSFLISDGDWPTKDSDNFHQIWLPKTDTSYNRSFWVYGETLHRQLIEKGIKFVGDEVTGD